MFDNVVKARDEGLSIAFFSGNAVAGEVIMYESSVNGAPCRAFARRQKFENEETLMGVTSYGSGYGDWVVTKPQHWIYEGTNLKAGDRIRGVIGWEYHGPPLGKLQGLEVVASSQADPYTASRGWPYPGALRGGLPRSQGQLGL